MGGAFIIDAVDGEIIVIAAVGIGGSHIRDIIIETVKARFGGMRATTPV